MIGKTMNQNESMNAVNAGQEMVAWASRPCPRMKSVCLGPVEERI